MMSFTHKEADGHHEIVITQQCSHCKGVGLFQGMAERNTVAVVCRTCKGTGQSTHTVEWDDFTGRIASGHIKKVIECNPGICAGDEFDFGGMSYKDWSAGSPFPPKSEMRGYACPAWWYQVADYDKKPNWPECIGCGSFSGCQSFPGKAHCWEKFDREQAAAEKEAK